MINLNDSGDMPIFITEEGEELARLRAFYVAFNEFQASTHDTFKEREAALIAAHRAVAEQEGK